ERLGEVLLAGAMRLIAVAQLVQALRAAPAHVAPVIAHRILDYGEHHVFTRRLGIEMAEAFRIARAEQAIQRPGLADMEHFTVIVGVEEAAVADLPLLDEID